MVGDSLCGLSRRKDLVRGDSLCGLLRRDFGFDLTGVPNLNDVRPGWLVDQIPGATVVSTDAPTQTITITGGVFVSGSFYTFTGV